jgi:hypothetical protein
MGPGQGLDANARAAGVRTAAERQAETERLLQIAREEFPEWEVREVFGGWEAVPAGTPVIRSSDLQGVLDKLRAK